MLLLQTFRRHRLGLRSMRERAELVGGTLEVTSAPGAGTVVRATLPSPPPSSRGVGDPGGRG